MSWTELMASQSFSQKTFILRRPELDIFGGMIKIVTMLRQSLETQEKLEELKIMYVNVM